MFYSLGGSDLYSPELWSYLVSESCRLQVDSRENRGFIRNEVVGGFYYRETAFAAKVFATEWSRTGDKAYKIRAINAIDALKSVAMKYSDAGFPEPYWMPRGIEFKKGSIPATIILWHALNETHRLLNFDKFVSEDQIKKFLLLCKHPCGGYAHDVFDFSSKNKTSMVINTSAMALCFLSATCNSVNNELSLLALDIVLQQRADGCWPYLVNGYFQKKLFAYQYIIPKKIKNIYNSLLQDRSIFFADYLHHIVTLYYLLHSYNTHVPSKNVISAISNAIDFVLSNSDVLPDGSRRLNYCWEPVIRHVRHCNMKDISAYFYLLAALTKLKSSQWISSHDFSGLIASYSLYLECVLKKKGSLPAYQGVHNEIRLILPRPAESMLDKAFLYSFVVEDSLDV